jgi:hypothetical protein
LQARRANYRHLVLGMSVQNICLRFTTLYSAPLIHSQQGEALQSGQIRDLRSGGHGRGAFEQRHKDESAGRIRESVNAS